MARQNFTTFPLFACIFLLLSALVNGQNTIDQIDKVFLKNYETYFEEQRETIHLHLNKTTYASGEHIWFAAYMFDQKENKISQEDTYIYVALMNSEGEEVDIRTIWYSNGVGHGEFKLDDALSSGNYYLQAFTSKMNLFPEDDSSVYPIRIINFDSQLIPVDRKSMAGLRIDLRAESGYLVEDVFGSCVVRFRNALGMEAVPDSVLLIDKSDQKSMRIEVSKTGIGRFSLVPRRISPKILQVFYRDSVYELDTPYARPTGITISADQNSNKNKFLLTIATNKNSISELDKELRLMVHKDGNFHLLPVELDGASIKEELVVPFSELFPGVNTLSLITTEGEVLAERLIFNTPGNQVSSQLINVQKEKDSITLYLKNRPSFVNPSLNKASISVIPSKSIANDQRIGMTSRFHLNNYLSPSELNHFERRNYLKDPSALYDLDALLILYGTNRYQWRNIEKGIDDQNRTKYMTANLQGYVNAFDNVEDSLEVMLYSRENGIFELAPLSADKKFRFENLPLAKNSNISFTLLNKAGEPVYANFFFTIQPNTIRFRHKFYKDEDFGNPVEFKQQEFNPKFLKEAEQLEEVVVTADRLKRQQFFGKFSGRKITKYDVNKGTLENFIRTYGYRKIYLDHNFYDRLRSSTWQLYRTCQTVRGPILLFPGISFNGVYSRDIMDYANVLMEYIDEVYYLKNSRCDPGYFVVFTNDKYENAPVAESDKITKEFVVDIGHDLPIPFIRPVYFSLDSPSYNKYGIVSWVPDLRSNEQGVYRFKVPNDKQGSLNVHLEGYNDSGVIWSEQLEVELK